MQWKSKENKIRLQQKTELQEAIDELWNLMQIPKMSCSKIKKEIHGGIVWKVKNNEGRDSGALQYKLWRPGRLQLTNGEDTLSLHDALPIFGDFSFKVFCLKLIWANIAIVIYRLKE